MEEDIDKLSVPTEPTLVFALLSIMVEIEVLSTKDIDGFDATEAEVEGCDRA